MSNSISEENTQQPGGAVDKVRKAARQLAYDVRYKVKGQFKDGQKSDAASLKRAYMQQLGKSPAPGPVKAMARKMLIGEAYDLVDVSDTVNESVVNALLKVFTKTTQLEDADGNPAYEITDVVQEEMKEKKYKVRVTDKSTGKTYVRMADREKISQLRSDPRISSVEMTGYGDSYDKPVGKEKEEKKEVAKESNVPMTGAESQAQKSKMRKFDSSATQDMGRRTKDAYHKIRGVAVAANELRKDIKSLKGNETAKEEFIHEVNVEDDNPDANTKKIDVMKGKNKIIINPTQSEEMKPGEDDTSAEKTKESSADKRIRMVKRKILQSKMQAVRQGAGADIVAHTELEGEQISEGEGAVRYCPACDKDETRDECKAGGEYWDENSKPAKAEDPRGMKTKVDMVRNKLRAMGLKMSHVPEGEMVEDADLDKMKKDADANRARAAKLKDRNVTRGSAALAAREVERDVKKAAKTGPQQYPNPGKGVKKIEKPKPTHTKTGAMRVEETEDSLRDRRMERGGVDGNTRYDRAPKAPNTKKFGTGKTMAQKEMEKKYGKGASAMDVVKAQIRAKHGKGAIMDTKKK